MKLKILFFLLISLVCISAAPETNTKRCGESSFCRRCRKAQNDFGYEADMDSVVVHSNGFTIDVSNNKTPNHLLLKLECLESNTFRFQIDEKNPLKQRFRVTEVITEEPVKRSATIITDTVTVNVTCGSNKALLRNNPFTLEFYENNVRVVSVNRRQLMRFEELRNKPSQPTEYEDRDEWEETWEGYTDSKPNGPEAIAIDFTFDYSDILFGIPAHHDTFALKNTLYGEPYRLTTVDMTFYELDSRRPNYGVIPVIYGHGASGRSVGIFWHNSADTYVDIYDGQTSHFISEGGVIDVFIFLGPSPNEVFKQNSKITGVTNLPQLFTLAYHQCRWSYMTQTEVLTIAENFDKYDVPLDTMWLDIDWTLGKRYFEWNYTAFPTPLDMMATLKENGRHLVHIIDPHIKVDEDYRFYRENKEKDFYVKTQNGSNFEGDCWPGLSSYVDFFNIEARKFYADQYLLENFKENSVETGT
jgi:mannosyl-oligosaccharide alpha-1,3-glucosidase